MKKIGDRCGDGLETEETDLKNHLCWARIRVKGLTEKIPISIEIADEETIFSLPIWGRIAGDFSKKSMRELQFKEREEGGYRGRDPSNLSRLRDILGLKSSLLNLTEIKGGLLGERSHMGGKVTKGPTSDQTEGHLVLNK
uniref:Putative ovule protein n=1 Tax=Solanum chacoense TaxID=4108 RepID=A0A0V0GQT9_SOLCH